MPSSEVNISSVRQEIPRLYPKAHYHVHNCSPLFTILSQINPVHTLLSCYINSRPQISPVIKVVVMTRSGISAMLMR